jgi:beta-lactam-binding protein with PASTA domain
MMKAYLVIIGVLTFVVSPALAKEFWVAQDPDTKKCEIVNEKPEEEAKAARGKTTAEECPHKPSGQ